MSFNTFTSGQVLTASDLMTYVMKRSGLPLSVVHRSTTQSINNSTDTAVLWDVEDLDTDAIHSTSSNTSRMTIVTPGKYRAYGVTEWAGNATGGRDAWFTINGSGSYWKARESTPVATANTFVLLSGPLPVTLIAGDYVELWVRQSSGAALNIAISSYFGLEYISP